MRRFNREVRSTARLGLPGVPVLYDFGIDEGELFMATGRVGRMVVDLLVDAGVPVRALTHRSQAASALPANVEVVTGDLAVPDSLDAGLRGAGAVFLVWAAPSAAAPAVVERLASYARRVVFLSSPHQTPHPDRKQSPTREQQPATLGSLAARAAGDLPKLRRVA